MTISDLDRYRRMRDAEVLEPQLDAHLRYLRQLNQRPRSIAERRFAVLRAAKALGHPVLDVDARELTEWQQGLTPKTPSGRNSEIVHVSQYLKWCVMAGHRAEDPSPVLVRARGHGGGDPNPMPDADIARAMQAADPLLRLWIGLGAFCGLRCCEIATLAREDIVLDGEFPALRVHGKGGKTRKVALPANLLAVLTGGDYPERGYLFARLDGKPGPPSAMRVSRRINEHLHGLGIERTAHKTRHRYGSKLYGANHDLLAVADALGHASTNTTRDFYVKTSISAATAAAVEAISHLNASA